MKGLIINLTIVSVVLFAIDALTPLEFGAIHWSISLGITTTLWLIDELGLN